MAGDPWHHIHWKNSARTGLPQSKEFEKTPDSAITICFDIKRTPGGDDEALEHAISLAASVGDYVCRSAGIVRLVAGGINEETTDPNALLRSLALMKPKENWSLPDMLAIAAPFSAVLMIVQDNNHAGLREANRLTSTQRRVSAIVLSGFSNYEGSSNAVSDLVKTGARVVECRPGEAALALAMLSDRQRNHAAEPQAVATS